MTREERIAAGWQECWGLYDMADDTWWGVTRDDVGWFSPNHAGLKRRALTRTDAKRDAVGSNDSVIARRFWRRTKPRKLKVGDVVTVRATVIHAFRDGSATVARAGGAAFPVRSEDIVR